MPSILLNLYKKISYKTKVRISFIAYFKLMNKFTFVVAVDVLYFMFSIKLMNKVNKYSNDSRVNKVNK